MPPKNQKAQATPAANTANEIDAANSTNNADETVDVFDQLFREAANNGRLANRNQPTDLVDFT